MLFNESKVPKNSYNHLSLTIFHLTFNNYKMKILSTFSLTPAQAYSKLKKFSDADKRRKNTPLTRDAKLTNDQRARVKGIVRSIKLINHQTNRRDTTGPGEGKQKAGNGALKK